MPSNLRGLSLSFLMGLCLDPMLSLGFLPRGELRAPYVGRGRGKLEHAFNNLEAKPRLRLPERAQNRLVVVVADPSEQAQGRHGGVRKLVLKVKGRKRGGFGNFALMAA